ncbi:hypothetical protein ACN263_27325 [Micromonospora sp. WMMD729]|uniref:hypothetical protein n=1 Tax=Micromonospora sp. WMMD729 TaxID=3404127 RepID=UPI003BF59807
MGPIEAEWDRVAEETRATIEAAAFAPTLPESDRELSRAERLLAAGHANASTNPTAAIVYAFQAARVALKDYLPIEDEDLKESTLGRLIELSTERNLIDPAAAVVFSRLEMLGDLAHHSGRQVRTAEQAEEYVKMVKEFMTLLDHSPATVGRTAAWSAGSE